MELSDSDRDFLRIDIKNVLSGNFDPSAAALQSITQDESIALETRYLAASCWKFLVEKQRQESYEFEINERS